MAKLAGRARGNSAGSYLADPPSPILSLLNKLINVTHLTNLLHMSGDDHKVTMGETNHDVAISIPATKDMS